MGDEPRAKYGYRETPALDGAVLRRVGTNEEKWFSQNQLTSVLQSGDWIGKEGETVHLVTDEGHQYNVDASEASDAIVRQGGGAESQRSIDARRYDEKMRARYGSGVGNWFEAWNEGLLQGVSFGTYKAFAVKVLGEDPEAIKARAKYWRKTALAGEIYGAVVPFLASGGLTGAARVVPQSVRGTPFATSTILTGGGLTGIGAASSIIPAIGLPRLAIAGGEALGGGLGRAVAGRGLATAGGTTAAKLRGVAGRAIPTALAGGIDAAMYEGFSGISTAALSDDPFTAEAVLSEMGMGAVHGAKVGLVFGGAASILADISRGTKTWWQDRKTARLAGEDARMATIAGQARMKSTIRPELKELNATIRKNERAVNHLGKEEAKLTHELELQEERAYRKAANTQDRLDRAQQSLEREGYSKKLAEEGREARAIRDLKREVAQKESKFERSDDILERIKARRAHLGTTAEEKAAKEFRTQLEKLRKTERGFERKVQGIEDQLELLNNSIARKGMPKGGAKKKAKLEKKLKEAEAEKSTITEKVEVYVADRAQKGGTYEERLTAARERTKIRRNAMEVAREKAASLDAGAARTELGHLTKGYDTLAGTLHKEAHHYKQRMRNEGGDWDEGLESATALLHETRQEFERYFITHTSVLDNGSRIGRTVIDYTSDGLAQWGKSDGDLYDLAIKSIDEMEAATLNLNRELHRVNVERASEGKSILELDPLFENFNSKFGSEVSAADMLRSHKVIGDAVDGVNAVDAVAGLELFGELAGTDPSALIPGDIPIVGQAANVLAVMYAGKRLKGKFAPGKKPPGGAPSANERRLPTQAEIRRTQKLRALDEAAADLADATSAREAGPGKISPKGIPEELNARYRQAQRDYKKTLDDLEEVWEAEAKGYAKVDVDAPPTRAEDAAERAQQVNRIASEAAEETKKARVSGTEAAKAKNARIRARHEADLKNSRIRIRELEDEMESLGLNVPGRAKPKKKKQTTAQRIATDALLRGGVQGIYTGVRAQAGRGAVGTVIASVVGAGARGLMKIGLGTKVGNSYARQAKKIQAAVDNFVKPAGAIRRSAPRHAEDVLGEISFWMFGGEPPKSEIAGKGLSKLQRAYLARSEELHAVMGDQMSTMEHVNGRMSKLHALNEKLAMDLETKIYRRLGNVYAKMPKSPAMGSVMMKFSGYLPPDYEITKWARYVAATEDPLSIVDRMSDYRLTKTEVDALKDSYGEIYHRIQMQLMEALASSEKKLPHKKLMQVSLLWGVPMHTSMRADFITVLQNSYVPPPEPQQSSADLSRVRQSTEQLKTNFQRITAK